MTRNILQRWKMDFIKKGSIREEVRIWKMLKKNKL